MTFKEMKKWIDNASYEELLRQWRFAPSGSIWFKGEIGKHYERVMMKKKAEIGDEQHTAISKHIGWGK